MSGTYDKILTWFFVTLFVIVGIGARDAYSAPAITSAGTSLDNGQTFTISGSSFGSGDNAPLLWDNFESGTNGSSLNAQPMRGSWVHISDPTPTIYSTNYAHSGTQSAYTSNSDHYGNVRNNNLGSASRIYWSFWFRYNNNNCSACQTKLIQLWGNGPDQCDYGPGFMSGGFSGGWFASYNIASGNDCSTGKIQESYNDTPSQNTWHLAEVILQRSSNYGVADGTIIMRIDNRDQYSRVGNLITRMNGQDWRAALFFYGFTNNGGAGNFSIDDAYLNDSWSRVMLGNASQYSSCTVLDVQPVTSWGNGTISATANTGAYQSGQTAYLYVIDSTGAISNSRAVTIGSTSGGGSVPVPPPADSAPAITISSPTSSSTYTASSGSIDMAGAASDDNGVSSVTWSNDRGGSGSASISSGSWSVSGISLQTGTNVITVTATDTASQTATDSLSVVYNDVGSTTPPEGSVWNADSNIGGGQWYNSGVTYCVRILIPGEQITQSGNTIKLGFQGRSSGSYSIRGVSIAERDQNGGIGDVVDSTWKKVTFDKKAETYLAEPLIADSWESYQVVVPAGAEKVSNAIKFDIVQGRDYYVTFKIVTPSVYQNPPAGYSELYFDSGDHTQDMDWSGTGFGTTQDYHALSNIYITNEATSPTFK